MEDEKSAVEPLQQLGKPEPRTTPLRTMNVDAEPKSDKPVLSVPPTTEGKSAFVKGYNQGYDDGKNNKERKKF
jgi:hypothetical protein